MPQLFVEKKKMSDKFQYITLHLRNTNFELNALKAIEDMNLQESATMLKGDPEMLNDHCTQISEIDQSDIDEDEKDSRKLMVTFKSVMYLSQTFTKLIDVAEGALINGIVKIVVFGGFESMLRLGNDVFLTLMHDHIVEKAIYRISAPRIFILQYIEANKLGPEESWSLGTVKQVDAAVKEHIAMCESIYATDEKLSSCGGNYDSSVNEKTGTWNNTALNLDEILYNDRLKHKHEDRSKRAKEIIVATMQTPIIMLAKEYADNHRATNQSQALTAGNIQDFFNSAIFNSAIKKKVGNAASVGDVIGNRGVRVSWEVITQKLKDEVNQLLR